MKHYVLSLLFVLLITCIRVLAQNNPPFAMDDFTIAMQGFVQFDVLDNDFDPDGNYISIVKLIKKPKHGEAIRLNDSIIQFSTFPYYTGGYDTLYYSIRDNGMPNYYDTAMMVIRASNPLTLDSVNVNNINAGVNADGALFQASLGSHTLFYAPAGGQWGTMYMGQIWIGGKDINDTLHLAASRYNQVGYDFWAGPVSSVYDNIYDLKYKRVWKILKSDLDYHIAHTGQPGYTPSQKLIDWPGNGDTSLGQSLKIAPFHDVNNDGVYDPLSGDYPQIKGDGAVFFVYNDDRHPHTESGGNKLGVEIRGMLYAFNCSQDSALWNTVFLHYEIENRSSITYYETYAGVWMDIDLGDAWDDFMGCDVGRGSFYGYNGKDHDGTGLTESYGNHCPAQSVTFFGGPYLDSDGMDNPCVDISGNLICDININGLNFGDGIGDNERYGMTRFVSFNNASPFPLFDPDNAIQAYSYMTGMLPDGDTLIHYWGNGLPLSGGTGPACRFMFPGDTDPCNWGTWGIDPGGTDPWTEIQAGNQPNDRRGIGSSGPFTFYPGAVHELDLAFVFARNFTDTHAVAAIPVMQERIDSIRKYFINDYTPCGGSFSGKPVRPVSINGFKIYPNPAQDYLTIEHSYVKPVSFEIFNMVGTCVFRGTLGAAGCHRIALQEFESGMYFIRFCGEESGPAYKFIKY